MKRVLTTLALVGMAASAFGAPSRIELVAPHVTAWSQTINGFTYNASPAEIASLNTELTNAFNDLENTLNTDFFSNFEELTDLSRGFANSNAAAFDNASQASFQNYDLFAFTLGTNLGASAPVISFNSEDYIDVINDIPQEGDVYAGVASGGVAGQLGVNLGFLVPKLSASIKVGAVPSQTISGASFQQFMFGAGINYSLVSQFDVLAGLFKWRGVSVGTGFTVNNSSVNVTVPINDQSTSISTTLNGQPVTGTAAAENIKATLKVKTSSVVVPLDIMTSVQVLYLVHFGMGLGLDFAFSDAQIGLGGSSDLTLSGIEGVQSQPGSAKIIATDSSSSGDLFMPRIAGSVGFDVAFFKLDVPVTYYPLSKSLALGITTGIVW